MEGILKLQDSEHIYCLDAGHGINTPGKRSPKWVDAPQLREWLYTRNIRKELVGLLDAYKISYFIVNPEDKDISLTERVNRINKIHREHGGKTITISIHGNAAGVESASGYEIFTSPGQTTSDKYADIFFAHAEMTKEFRMRRDRTDGDNDKEARFTILTNTIGPSVLTESGFYTNKEECKKMSTHSFTAIIAVMHLSAILEIENASI